MPNKFWIYFLSKEELLETYRRASGTRGNFDKDDPHDVHNATHEIFLHLNMLAHIQVWFGLLDGVSGMAFIIGHVDDELSQTMTRPVAQRCHKVFGCPPGQWTELAGPDSIMCSLEKEGKMHTLRLLHFLESNLAPRDY